VSSSLYARPVRAGAAELDRLESLVAGLDTEVDPVHIVRVGIAAFYVDRLDGCREALRRVVRDGRGGGAATSAVNALLMLCHDAFLDGRWDEARRTAEEGVTWGRTLGYELIALPGLYCLALVAAVRGDEEATQTLTEEMTAWAAPRGVTMLEHFACRVRGLAALGRDDYEEAYRQATAISPAGQLVAHAPVALGMALDLVEAAVRSGRQADAEAHVAAVQQAEVFRLRPRLALIADGAAGVAASGPDPRRAEQHFDRALAVPDAALYPFEHARVQLAYGAHLRRTRAMHASRRQLTAALRTFTRLGARPWADRAEQELRVSGLTHRSATDGGAAPLSAQEYRIASLAASGLTNKQIATRLHLSPRTVSSHLYRVFPKLGIGTRAALRDALANTTAPEDRRPG
jgi:ATP/maltotriose-dependent transcriptional regulator MalT